MSNDPSTDAHERYLAERKLAIDAEHKQSELYDRSALTVASGALGLSFAVAGNLVRGEMAPIMGWALWLGWFALVVSILSTLLSFRASEGAWRNYASALSTQQEQGHWPEMPTRWKAVGWLNSLSTFGLIVGLFSLAAFGAANLTAKEFTMTDKQLERRGSTPPAPPASNPNGGSTPPAPPTQVSPPPPPPPPAK